MKNPGIATMAVMVLVMLFVAACAPAPKTTQPAPAAQPPELPAAAEAPTVPEIAQAEQSVDEIGVQELGEIEKDTDELVLP